MSRYEGHLFVSVGRYAIKWWEGFQMSVMTVATSHTTRSSKKKAQITETRRFRETNTMKIKERAGALASRSHSAPTSSVASHGCFIISLCLFFMLLLFFMFGRSVLENLAQSESHVGKVRRMMHGHVF